MPDEVEEISKFKSCGNIVCGGKLENGIDEDFFVDSNTHSMQVNLSATSLVAAKLSSPDGVLYNSNVSQKLSDGQQMLQFMIENPNTGKWKLSSEKSTGAYLVVIQLSSHASSNTQNVKNLKYNSKILKTYPDHFEFVSEFDLNKDTSLANLKNGIYNIETTHSGELSDGSPYNRTSIKSLLINNTNFDLKEFLKNL